MSSLCRLKPIFPAVAAHTKAGKIGNLLLNALTASVSHPEKHQVCMRYLATLSLKNSPFLFELTVFPKSRPSSQIPGFRAGRLETHRGSNPPWSGTAPGAHKHARTACLTIFSFKLRLPNLVLIKKQFPNPSKNAFSYCDKLGSFCLSRLCRLKPIFPAVAAHTKAGKIGTLLLNALKTSFSYFDKLGSFCLSRLCRLKPIFPAVAAHTKAGKIGTLLLTS